MSEEKKFELGQVLRMKCSDSCNAALSKGDLVIAKGPRSDKQTFVWSLTGTEYFVNNADCWDTGIRIEPPHVAVGWRLKRGETLVTIAAKAGQDAWKTAAGTFDSMTKRLLFGINRCLEYVPPDFAELVKVVPQLPEEFAAAPEAPPGEPPVGSLLEALKDFGPNRRWKVGSRLRVVSRDQGGIKVAAVGEEPVSSTDVLIRGDWAKVLSPGTITDDHCTKCYCTDGEWGKGFAGRCPSHDCACSAHWASSVGGSKPTAAVPAPASGVVVPTPTPLVTHEHLPLQAGDVLFDPNTNTHQWIEEIVDPIDNVQTTCPEDPDYDNRGEDSADGQEWLATEWPQLIARVGLSYKLTGGVAGTPDDERRLLKKFHGVLVKVTRTDVHEPGEEEEHATIRVRVDVPGFGQEWWNINRFKALTGPPEGSVGDVPTEGKTEEDKEQMMPTKEQIEADSKFKDVAVLRSDTAQIVIPVGMSKSKAAEWLLKADREDEKKIAFSHEIEAYPLEGAYALFRALEDKFGFVSLEKTPGFFGDNPPTMVGLDVSINERVNVPWGRLSISGIAGYMETNAMPKPSGQILFVLSGETTRRDEDKINEIVALVREYVTKGSIYKGHAIKVNFPKKDDGWDFSYTPKFVDTRDTRVEDLIFPQEVQDLVTSSLFVPIERTAMCRANQIPLKRGILLEGPYGVGKTLTAGVTAKKCTENGWTFMYLEKVADLKKAVALARQYQPCVIFAEDIDRAVEGERSTEMDEILNTIDGIDGKASEILVVLTTNNVEKINRAMLRPGRLDAVIPVRPPDAVAAERLVRLYARGLIHHEEDLSEVGRRLAGQIPAVIRETVERAKLGAIAHMVTGQTNIELASGDLITASNSMLVQLDLMRTPAPDKRSDREKSASILVKGLLQASGLVPLKEESRPAFASANGHSQLTTVEEEHPTAG